MVFTMEANGVKASYPTDGSCTLDTMEIPGQEGVYEAIQFHLHSSSEHTIDGSYFGAELHVVHQRVWDGDTRLAVVGMIFEPNNNENNPLFETLLTKLDESNDAVMEVCDAETLPEVPTNTTIDESVRRRLQAFDIYSMLDSDTGFYHYDGGLTTPPCSEIVWWNLADTTVNISVKQYNRLMNLVLGAMDETSCDHITVADPNTGSTSRPPVPLGDRTVQRVCPKDAEPAPTATPADDASSAASFLSVVGALAVSAAVTAFL
jgi:carbonic anhydrase